MATSTSRNESLFQIIFMFGVALTCSALDARQSVTSTGLVKKRHSSTTTMARSMGRLSPDSSALLVCDVQERFRSVISGYPAVIDTSRRMIRAAELLKLPILVTEQYPKALGSTVSELAEVLPEQTLVVAKTKFSMLVEEIVQAIKSMPQIKSILIVGNETHVCVLQTALDLLEDGYDVHIVVDGVSSQRLTDRSTALTRLAQSGAFMTTSEMVLFQMMVDTSHPVFKAISALCKEPRVDPLPHLH